MHASPHLQLVTVERVAHHELVHVRNEALDNVQYANNRAPLDVLLGSCGSTSINAAKQRIVFFC